MKLLSTFFLMFFIGFCGFILLILLFEAFTRFLDLICFTYDFFKNNFFKSKL